MKLVDFQEFVGKTVSEVTEVGVNCIVFRFTDGTQAGMMADCGTGRFDIPFLELIG